MASELVEQQFTVCIITTIVKTLERYFLRNKLQSIFRYFANMVTIRDALNIKWYSFLLLCRYLFLLKISFLENCMVEKLPRRYYWIDNLKFFCLFLVIYGHVGTSTIHTLIYGFHMPIFFFLSGMLHKDKSIEATFKNLVVPYLLFNFLFLALEIPWLYKSSGSIDFLLVYLKGIILPYNHPIDYPTWFLISLFEIKLIIHLLQNNLRLIFLFLIFGIVLLYYLNLSLRFPFFFKNTLIGMAYYCIGAVLSDGITKEHNAISRISMSIMGGGNIRNILHTDVNKRWA